MRRSTLALPDPVQAPQARLRQCLLLALLAHVLLVLVFGSAPPGSALPGEGAWGRLVIRLQGPTQAGIDSDQPLPDTGPKGDAQTRRYGGTVRTPAQAARKAEQPGAAQLGQWRPADSNTPAPADTATLTPPPEPGNVPLPAVQAAPEPVAPPQALAPVPTPTATLAAPPPPTRMALPQPIAPAAVTPAPTSTLQDVPRPTATLHSQPDTTRRAAPVAIVQKLVAPAQPDSTLTSVPLPTAELAAPQRSAPTTLAAPQLQPLNTQTPTGALTAVPRPTATLQAPSTAPQRAALPTASELKRSDLSPTEAAPLQDVQTPTARMEAATASSRAAAQPLPQPSDIRAITPSPNVNSEELQPLAPPAGLAGTLGNGGPDRGNQLGHDVATAPSAKDQRQPLNLSLPMQGPRISSTGTTSGLLAAVPRPPEHEDKLKKDVDKAKREDCRSAYAAGGLLAAIPIAIDTVRDKGCKW